MNRGDVSNFLRNVGLLHLLDFSRFLIRRAKNKSRNRGFRKNNPTIKIPPDYLLYESFAIDYKAYFEGGIESANDLCKLFSKYKSQKNLNILDWGCGPGRIIRHMPDFFDASCNYYGTDYNSKSISWCSQNIPIIKFSQNDLSPPLNYQDNLFDIIYGISIFTHLSKDMHFEWIKELHRILNKDGILLLTSAGNVFKTKLTQKEIIRFDKGELIIRSKVKEGHRTYTVFHPLGFMQKLFSEFTILEHIEREPVNSYIPQDIWILNK